MPPVTQDELPLPLAHYRLRFRGPAAARWPEFAGSAWRGVLGHQLRRVLCVTHQPACPPCSLYRSCGYPYIFETPPPPGAAKQRLASAAPHPYVLRPHPWRDGSTELDLILFGRGHHYVPYIIQALAAGARAGVGPGRVALELRTITQQCRPGVGDWRPVYGAGELRAFGPWPPVMPAAPAAVRVRLLTPLRATRDEARVTAASFSFAAFFMTLLRRISLLSYFHAGKALDADFAGLAALARATAASAVRLRWQDWARRSSRQGKLVPMGGLVGEFQLAGPALAEFWPYLWLGQWTHAGKGAVMGLGQFALAAVTA